MKLSSKVQWAIATGLIVILVAVKLFYLDFFTIPQNGMYPALPAGSFLWMNKLAYFKTADVQRGDIAIYNHTEDGQSYTYIWRVIGLPGEHIETRDNELIINGKLVPQELLRKTGTQQIYLEKHTDTQFEICFDASASQLPPSADMILGPDEFFLMGDNRYSAADSRYKGPVKFNAIRGKKF